MAHRSGNHSLCEHTNNDEGIALHLFVWYKLLLYYTNNLVHCTRTEGLNAMLCKGSDKRFTRSMIYDYTFPCFLANTLSAHTNGRPLHSVAQLGHIGSSRTKIDAGIFKQINFNYGRWKFLSAWNLWTSGSPHFISAEPPLPHNLLSLIVFCSKFHANCFASRTFLLNLSATARHFIHHLKFVQHIGCNMSRLLCKTPCFEIYKWLQFSQRAATSTFFICWY